MNLSLLLILTIGLGLGWSRPLRLGPGTVNPEPPEWDDIALGFFRTSECVRCLDTCARMDGEYEDPKEACPEKCTGDLRKAFEKKLSDQSAEVIAKAKELQCYAEDDPHWAKNDGTQQEYPDWTPTPFDSGAVNALGKAADAFQHSPVAPLIESIPIWATGLYKGWANRELGT